MRRDVTLEKIGYMMNRLGGDDELSADDLEALIIKVFVSSFEYEHGFEAALIRELLHARNDLMNHELTSDDDEISLVPDREVEDKYLQFQREMYVAAGYDPEYAEESASWPDALPLNGDWDEEFLRDMARKEVAHHLVVHEQIRAEIEKHKNDNANS